MEANHETSQRKLVYLSDRSPRPRSRGPKTIRHDVAPAPGELAAEAAWLARALVAVAAGIVLLWLLRLDHGGHPPGSDGWGGTAVGAAFGHLLLAGCAAAAILRLLRDPVAATVPVALAAGAIGVTAAQGIARLVLGGDLAAETLSVRTEILAYATAAAVAVWAASWAHRLERSRHPTA